MKDRLLYWAIIGLVGATVFSVTAILAVVIGIVFQIDIIWSACIAMLVESGILGLFLMWDETQS